MVGASGAKQTTETNQIENNTINSSAQTKPVKAKCGQRFEFGTIVKQIQIVVRAGLEPGTAGWRVQHADYTAIVPPNLFMTFHTPFRCNTTEI